MNKLKEYKDKINKLEKERVQIQKENDKIDIEIENLNTKRDKTVLVFIPASLVSMVTLLLIVYNVTHNPNVMGSLAAFTGCSVSGLGIESLRQGLKIGKLLNKKEDNELKLDKNEYDLEYAKQVLESYEKINSISNEDIMVNKDNLVHNNSFVNNIVKSRDKIRSLSYKKANNIRK